MIELTYVIWYKQVEVNDMNYNFSSDIKSIREILDLTQEDLAVQIDVQQKTISKNESEEIEPSEKLLEIFYAYAFSKNIRLNKLKEMIWRDELEENEKLLFHGAKNEITGNIDIYIKEEKIMILGKDFIQVKAMNRLFHLFRDMNILQYTFFDLMIVI